MISKSRLTSDQRDLLGYFDLLGTQERETLLAFAEFLAARKDSTGAEVRAPEAAPMLPRIKSRPQKETVIGAIKRLSETYYMLDKSKLLTETSSLMSAHIMHGRKAPEVIDDLEALFSSSYQQHNSSKGL